MKYHIVVLDEVVEHGSRCITNEVVGGIQLSEKVMSLSRFVFTSDDEPSLYDVLSQPDSIGRGRMVHLELLRLDSGFEAVESLMGRKCTQELRDVYATVLHACSEYPDAYLVAQISD